MDEPSRGERSVRFGCGVLFGAAVAGALIAWSGGMHWPGWLFVVAAALVCGYAAVRWGDTFWQWALELIRWS